MAAQEVAAQAPARAVSEWDSSAEGASGLESSGVGASFVERVLGVAETNRCEPAWIGSVTGSVSDQTARLALGPTKLRRRSCRLLRGGWDSLEEGSVDHGFSR